jgi:tetratricopeptide (TPR) repeat protein
VALHDEARWEQIKLLFDRVCDLPAAQQRPTLEAENLAPDIIDEVLSLCSADTRSAHLLRPVADALRSLQIDLEPGTRLGAWRILSPLAAGGMGRVYLAERDDGQYQQRAAIKLLQHLAGSSDEEYLLRERQILADLQHPHIARLLDGGRAANGQPYLVMEYIEGERIDRWCAQHAPGLEARLRLFQSVCRAVHHAHRHLVLHCDLKPSNVLVRADGAPVLLDFGIARLLDADSVSTAAGETYLTPRYASPEQRQGGALSVASDVYSLGVLLSELLAPPAIASAGAELPTHPPSARAKRDGVRWAKRLRGDLDAIVRRATATDPAQRYASAERLAEDIDRYFARQPLHAGPDRWSYRATRLLQRRWPAFAVGALFVATIAVFGWRLADERDRALQAEAQALREAGTSQQVSDFLISIFENADPERGARPDITARELLDNGRREIALHLADRPAVRRRLLTSLGWIYNRVGLPEPSLELLREAEALVDATSDAHERAYLKDALAQALWQNDNLPEAEAAARAAVELSGHSPQPADLGQAYNTLGMVLAKSARYAEAESAYQQALEIREKVFGEAHEKTASTLHNLALLARDLEHFKQAEHYLQRANAIKEKFYGPDHPRVLLGLQQYATLLREQVRLREAEAILRHVLEARLRINEPVSLPVSAAYNELGSLLHDLGRYDEAARLYREALKIDEVLQGAQSPGLAVPLNNLASAQEDRGDLAAAEPLFRRSLAIRTAAYAADHPAVARARHNLGRLLVHDHRLDEGEALLRAAFEVRLKAFGATHGETLGSHLMLGETAWLRGDLLQAREQLAAAEAAAAGIETVFPTQRAALLRLRARLAEAGGDLAAAIADWQAAEAALASALPDEHPLRAEYALERYARQPAAQRDPAELARIAAILRSALAAQAPALALLDRVQRSAS